MSSDETKAAGGERQMKRGRASQKSALKEKVKDTNEEYSGTPREKRETYCNQRVIPFQVTGPGLAR